MKSCPECGCRTSDGVCSNCQEELYILENQGDFIDTISQGFADKAEEQRRFLKDAGRETDLCLSLVHGNLDITTHLTAKCHL